jgi:hypothetical protein
MAGNWWIDGQGRNNLAGIPDSATNPAILPDYLIVEFLLNYPQAKTDFYRMLPTMSAEEQERLNELVEKNPYCMAHNVVDPVAYSDRIQHRYNTQGVRTRMPKRSR